MTNPYRLKNKIDPSSNADLDDVWVVKKNLDAAGYYKTPNYGLTPFPDEGMFDAIKAYQRDNRLFVDGIMKPDGETEQSMMENLAVRSPTLWCKHCKGPHGGVYSTTVCYQCWNKGLR